LIFELYIKNKLVEQMEIDHSHTVVMEERQAIIEQTKQYFIFKYRQSIELYDMDYQLILTIKSKLK
jgi:hypothetical protein